MLLMFRSAIFLGAGLLFLIQPMFAKMVLPLLGGSSAVWNTCMLFFQGMLLAGYLYAHLSRRFLGTRGQVFLHLMLLIGIALIPSLMISDRWDPPENETPIFWLLGLLFMVVGGPFFVVSATSPLLQAWFAEADHQRASSPYFLYSASNAGSITALLAFPFVLERVLSVDSQILFWKFGYYLFACLMIGCGLMTLKRPGTEFPASPGEPSPASASASGPITWQKRGLWILLAFVPSSWMLGVTSFLTTDLAPMPILWIIPLSIYLVTFIVAFSDRPLVSRLWVYRLFPVSMLILVATTIFRGGLPLIGIHLLVYLIGAMACHFELASRKPDSAHLTEFYLWISVGGLLGGLFNGLIAPLVFPWILEYPIALMLACVCCMTFSLVSDHSRRSDSPLRSRDSQASRNMESRKSAKRKRKTESVSEPEFQNERDPARTIRLGLFVLFALMMAIMANLLEFQGTVALILTTIAALIAMTLLYFLDRPGWFAIPLGIALILAKLEPPQPGERVLFTGRSYFGVNRVVEGPQGFQKRLYHGTTVHGIQSTNPERPELNLQPMSYYHPTGPLGMAFEFGQRKKEFRNVGVVGLGAGTAASYHRTGQSFDFFEIDPIVKQIAENPDYFTFLQACGGENYRIVLGDGRRKLALEPDQKYDFLVFDAFSSDAIPIHLLTKEAVAMYAGKLSPDGFMAFHISNLHFDLEPILGDIAAELDLESITCHDRDLTEEEMIEGKAAASYVIICPDLDRTGLQNHPQWNQTRRSGRQGCWTDDFSNVLDALKPLGK